MKYVVESLNPVRSPSLFQLTEELSTAIAKIEEDPETGELVGTEDFDALQVETKEKLVSCGCAITNFRGLMGEIDDQIKALVARKRFVKNLVERIEHKCIYSMECMGIKSLKAAPVSMGLRKTEAVEVYDPSMLDSKFFVTPPVKPKVSKIMVKAAIESGEHVDGAELITYHTLQVK